MKYTAEEVREAAATNKHPIPLRVRDMLTDYADSIERAQAGVTDELMRSVNIQPASPAGVPEGWVMVPRDPTKAMLATYEHVRSGADWQENVFRLTKKQLARHKAAYMAMLTAAPSPGESA